MALSVEEELLDGFAVEDMMRMARELHADATLSVRCATARACSPAVQRLRNGTARYVRPPQQPRHEPAAPPPELPEEVLAGGGCVEACLSDGSAAAGWTAGRAPRPAPRASAAPAAATLPAVLRRAIAEEVRRAVAAEVQRAAAEEAERLERLWRRRGEAALAAALGCVEQLRHAGPDSLQVPQERPPVDKRLEERHPVDKGPKEPQETRAALLPSQVMSAPQAGSVVQHELDRNICAQVQAIISQCDDLTESTCNFNQWQETLWVPSAGRLAFRESSCEATGAQVEDLVRHTAAVVELELRARQESEQRALTRMREMKCEVHGLLTRILRTFCAYCWAPGSSLPL